MNVPCVVIVNESTGALKAHSETVHNSIRFSLSYMGTLWLNNVLKLETMSGLYGEHCTEPRRTMSGSTIPDVLRPRAPLCGSFEALSLTVPR